MIFNSHNLPSFAVIESSSPPQEEPLRNPCIPSPCGPYSQCQSINGGPSCSCLPTYFGVPPNCRPECSINAECLTNLACINQKCQDPCPGSCGLHAHCNVLNHVAICSCEEGYTGDPFVSCHPKPAESNLLLFWKMNYEI